MQGLTDLRSEAESGGGGGGGEEADVMLVTSTQAHNVQMVETDRWWKCALCPCDHTMCVFRSISKGTGLLGKLIPTGTILCKPCRDYLNSMLAKSKKQGIKLTEAELSRKIEARRNSTLRAENLRAKCLEMGPIAPHRAKRLKHNASDR